MTRTSAGPAHRWYKPRAAKAPAYRSLRALQQAVAHGAAREATARSLLTQIKVWAKYPDNPPAALRDIAEAAAHAVPGRYLGFSPDSLHDHAWADSNARWSVKLLAPKLSPAERERLRTWFMSAQKALQEFEDAEWVSKARAEAQKPARALRRRPAEPTEAKPANDTTLAELLAQF